MKKTNYFKFVIVTFSFLTIYGNLFSQPTTTDYILGYSGLAVSAGGEFLLKKKFSPDKPKWAQPNSFDLFFRDKLKWRDVTINRAAKMSDILLFGFVIPSVFLTPLLTDNNYGHHLLLNFQIVAATSILTNLAKYSFKRQRPYSFFKTLTPKGYDDYLSFFSGHTSFSFAIAMSTAHILEKDNPHNSALIWSSSLLIASATGYLRIAADRHYFTDVIGGAVLGGLAGYLISKNQSSRFFKKGRAEQHTLFSVSLPL